jgi:hypothetical protein
MCGLQSRHRCRVCPEKRHHNFTLPSFNGYEAVLEVEIDDAAAHRCTHVFMHMCGPDMAGPPLLCKCLLGSNQSQVGEQKVGK